MCEKEAKRKVKEGKKVRVALSCLGLESTYDVRFLFYLVTGVDGLLSLVGYSDYGPFTGAIFGLSKLNAVG